MSELESTLADLNKRFGKRTIVPASEHEAATLQRISTGSLSLDIATGGGLPRGRIVEFFGTESCGKTFMAAKCVVEAQKLGLKCVWIDAEGTLDREWFTTLGVDLKKLYLCVPDTGEKALDILEATTRSGDCGLVVLDAISALIPTADLDKSMEDSEQLGIRAKMVNRAIRKLYSALNSSSGADKTSNRCIALLINHIQYKTGGYGNPETTGGGQQLKNAASIRAHFRKSWIKDEQDAERILGQTIRVVIEKNKTAPPCKRAEFDIYTDGNTKGQIDVVRELFNAATTIGLIELSGRTYTVGKESVVGKEKTIEYLTNNPKVVEILRKQVLDKYFKEK